MPDQRQITQELLRAEAATGFEIRISGECMVPALESGDRVIVRASRCYLPGDILVHLAPDGRRLSHRLLGYYRRRGAWRLLTQADNAPHPDFGVAAEQVLGKVAGVDIGLRQRLRALLRYCHFALIGRRSPRQARQ